MPSQHARLQPSAAKRWLNCPGSIALCENVVDTGSQYADEGTAAHEVCERALNHIAIGPTASNGVPVTKEILDLAKPCIEFVEDYRDLTGAEIHTEMKVEIGKSFGLPEGHLFGTADIVARSERELAIMDFKFGYNDVSVSEDGKPNPQLALYARGAGAALALGKTSVRLVILQPKCGEPKEKVFTTEELFHYFQEIAPKVKEAHKGGPLVPGPWCKETFCKARAVCPALREEMLALARREFANPHEWSPEEIGQMLVKLSMIEDAASALRAHAMKLDEIGTKIPGWKRVKGKTNLAWMKDEPEVAKAIKKAGVHPFEEKLISAANARDQIADILYEAAKKRREKFTRKDATAAALAVLKGLADRPEGAPVLVPDTDERPALPPVFTKEDVAALEAVDEID